eukprot:7825129-Heterocapsa_arctica.AAC.1
MKLKFITKTLKDWPVQSEDCPLFKSLTEEAEAMKAALAVDQPWELQVLRAQEDVNTGKRRVMKAEKALAGVMAQQEKVLKAIKSAKDEEAAGRQAVVSA